MLRIALVALALVLLPAAGQAGDLTPKAAGEVVDQLIRGMDTYVDPEKAKAVQTRLRDRRGAYARLGDRQAFAEAVSRDLVDVSGDKHLKVSVQTFEAGQGARLTAEQQAIVSRRSAYGFMAARRLPANIGYIKLRNFDGTDSGVALMDTLVGLLKDTDALIIDLRENTGGGGADAALLGHLSRTPIPMVRIHWRNADGSEELDTRVPRAPPGGALYPDKPVYVLTSAKTFSAAEEFAYDLKASKRAVLVGETTRGGANPANRPVPLPYGLRVFIPNGRVEHPLTGASWEGVGASPDVVTPAKTALVEAYRLALAAGKPEISTPQSEAERERAMADPGAALEADAGL
jgi:C-terminal processing protease CtpA/Prc